MTSSDHVTMSDLFAFANTSPPDKRETTRHDCTRVLKD